MSENLQQCFKLFSIISKINNLKTRKCLLNKSYCEPMYDAIVEIITNIKAKNIRLQSSDKRKLRKYGSTFQSILNKKISPRRKRYL